MPEKFLAQGLLKTINRLNLHTTVAIGLATHPERAVITKDLNVKNCYLISESNILSSLSVINR